jgi:CubicO group peptidase (beta-lactamase class C family)
MTINSIASRLKAFLLAFSLTISPCYAAENKLDRAAETFESQRAKGFTGYVIIVHEGKIVFSQGAGIADAQSATPFAETTQFDIASISKTITGLLVAEEITQGRIKPDSRLDMFFDIANMPLGEITIQQLLTHTAGLVDVVGEDSEAISLQNVVKRAAQTPLLDEPGTQYRYSNLGYSLLAAALEQHLGLSYEEIAMRRLAAVNAYSTGYAKVLDRAKSVRRADGRTICEMSWGGHPPGGNLIGNGGMISTPGDMARWLSAFSDGRLVSAEARDLARTAYVDETGEGQSFYGYGLVVEEDDTLGTIFWHNGGSRQFNSHWRELLDKDVIIIALSDQPPSQADRMVLALQRAMFPD